VSISIDADSIAEAGAIEMSFGQLALNDGWRRTGREF
jgi:hypothetical protein